MNEIILQAFCHQFSVQSRYFNLLELQLFGLLTNIARQISILLIAS